MAQLVGSEWGGWECVRKICIDIGNVLMRFIRCLSVMQVMSKTKVGKGIKLWLQSSKRRKVAKEGWIMIRVL